MLKHLPKDALKTVEKTYLYSKELVYYNDVNINRRNHNGGGITTKKNYAKDLNIDDGITKFKEMLKNERAYRILLQYFTDNGKINFSTKIDYRVKLHLEKDMKKLFESRKVLAADADIPSPGAKIIFTKVPFI